MRALRGEGREGRRHRGERREGRRGEGTGGGVFCCNWVHYCKGSQNLGPLSKLRCEGWSRLRKEGKEIEEYKVLQNDVEWRKETKRLRISVQRTMTRVNKGVLCTLYGDRVGLVRRDGGCFCEDRIAEKGKYDIKC